MTRLQLAIDQIVFARSYTLELLEQTPTAEWFRQAPGGISHIGWQVGHLACAEYRMTLWRVFGAPAQDEALFSPDFARFFGANSVPAFDATQYPSPAQIRAVLDRVHERVLGELPALSDSEMDDPVPQPHPFAQTKLKALLWCAQHEMVHAGQIGLLRRQLGHPSLW